MPFGTSGCHANHINASIKTSWANMATISFELVGNSADSRGLARCPDILSCHASDARIAPVPANHELAPARLYSSMR
jgi:hypothetical protein